QMNGHGKRCARSSRKFSDSFWLLFNFFNILDKQQAAISGVLSRDDKLICRRRVHNLRDHVLRTAKVEAGGIGFDLGENVAGRTQRSSKQFCVGDQKFVALWRARKRQGDYRTRLRFLNFGVDKASHPNCGSKRRTEIRRKLFLRKGETGKEKYEACHYASDAKTKAPVKHKLLLKDERMESDALGLLW